MADFRYPNITGKTEAEQLSQIKDYLFKLTTQLNLAKDAADDMEKNVTYQEQSSQVDSQEKTEDEKAKETFFTIKNLIIKSADIVNAYYDVIKEKLVGEYEAISKFGTFKEKTESQLYETSTSATKSWTSLKEIIVPYVYGEVDGDEIKLPDKTLAQFRKDGGYLKTGFLDDEHTIIGVEIGQTTETADGKSSAFARFTPQRLSFFDPSAIDENGNPIELAYFGNRKLYITNAEIEENLSLGKYMLDTSDGIAFKWIG
jgi:hypothetical protein